MNLVGLLQSACNKGLMEKAGYVTKSVRTLPRERFPNAAPGDVSSKKKEEAQFISCDNCL